MTKHGIHHITAIASQAPRNLDFYTRILGLRLVKRTVNFDDPGTYHLYYGDETGQPGTILTFFPWAHTAPGRLGVGETREIMLRVPEGAIGFWAHRLIEKGVAHDAPVRRFGETILPFKDPDGMRLALTGIPGIESEPAWTGSDIAAGHAIRGLHGVSLLLDDAKPEASILTEVLGFEKSAAEERVTRFKAKGTGIGGIVDIHASGSSPAARIGAGSVHHIAFRASGDEEQAGMAARLARDLEIETTQQLDRHYFRSVYFRSPGGVLFEIATDDPGFTADEPASGLGRSLKLPLFLEPRRQNIEAALPALEIEGATASR